MKIDFDRIRLEGLGNESDSDIDESFGVVYRDDNDKFIGVRITEVYEGEELTIPHVRVATSDFIAFLRAAKHLGQRTNHGIYYPRYIQVSVVDDEVVFRATYDGSYLEVHVDLLNTEHVLVEPVVVLLEPMKKILDDPADGEPIWSLPELVIVLAQYRGTDYDFMIDEDNRYAVKLPTKVVPPSDFLCDATFVERHRLPAAQVLTAMCAAEKIVKSSANPAEHYVVGVGDAAYVSYNWSLVKVDLPIPGIAIPAKGVALLKEVLKNDMGEVQILVSEKSDDSKRVLIEGDRFRSCFPVGKVWDADVLIQFMPRVFNGDTVCVEQRNTYKLASIAAKTACYTLLNFTDDGNLELTIITRVRGKVIHNPITIESSFVRKPKPLAKNLKFDAVLLTTLLRTFQYSESIEVTITQYAVGIKSHTHCGMVLLEDTPDYDAK